MTPAKSTTEVEVEGRRLSLSNLDKVLYPEAGFTKAAVIDYYRRVAPALLAHLAGRALTLLRFPDGVDNDGFFEKNCPGHRPAWVRTAEVVGRSSGDVTQHCLVRDLPTLVWLANLAALELHTPMARADDIEHPTTVVFDLDPGPPAGMSDACRVALALRDLLGGLGLDGVPKTSGKKGLHVYVPLNQPGTDHEETREFAHALARILARRERGVLTVMDRTRRTGKVFVDWSQNARHKTTVAPYSLRATPSPGVSTPVTWDEVARASEGETGLAFNPADVAGRLSEDGDLFAAVLDQTQHLPKIEALGGAGTQTS